LQAVQITPNAVSAVTPNAVAPNAVAPNSLGSIQPSASQSISVLGPSIPALLVLADGTVFHGKSFGAATQKVGEVVFNTALTGYQEILSDPSYARQIVTLTYPHIGNTGTTVEDDEAAHVFASGLVVKDLPRRLSNWRSQGSLSEYLVKHGIPGIYDLDTRKLTRLLREKGAQNGCLVTGSSPNEVLDIGAALDAARGFPGLAGMDLAKEVSVKAGYSWTEGSWALNEGGTHAGHRQMTDQPFHVVAFDFGVKRNILRMLADRGCRLTVLPAQATAAQVLALKPDGVFLSNGPGDPEPCTYAITAARELIERGLPTFGICLGHQIMGLASGAKTLKMKFGHHGANHPVKDLDTGKVHITSQNHGFAVDPNSLPANLRITHVSLFDGTIQGLARTDKPAFCFQGHPEASPGPHDIAYLFDRFVALIKTSKQ
jgi:carbamoyl-phosphate synthase small subunit